VPVFRNGALNINDHRSRQAFCNAASQFVDFRASPIRIMTEKSVLRRSSLRLLGPSVPSSGEICALATVLNVSASADGCDAGLGFKLTVIFQIMSNTRALSRHSPHVSDYVRAEGAVRQRTD
jgi:hypothetical protein